MRHFITVRLLLISFQFFIALMLPANAVQSTQEWEDIRRFNQDATGAKLRIVSSTDSALFAPFIESFLRKNTDISIEYLVTGTADLNTRFRANPQAFDIAISSAMDLQLKLTNDGFALRLDAITPPSWSQWRQSLFAFTLEPAAIVINRSAFKDVAIPKSRQELIEALRARPETFRGRVGTYDVRQSGLGYLFATQDARASETFWRLMEVMGSLNARLYCCSGDMIDDLTNGKIAVAYNVLGSYAAARAQSQSVLEIILPSDFPTTMMRTALVSKDTLQPKLAESFIAHLLIQQSTTASEQSLLPPLSTSGHAGERAVIALEPALMTFLDSLKRKKFLSEWEDALIQD